MVRTKDPILKLFVTAMTLSWSRPMFQTEADQRPENCQKPEVPKKRRKKKP